MVHTRGGRACPNGCASWKSRTGGSAPARFSASGDITFCRVSTCARLTRRSGLSFYSGCGGSSRIVDSSWLHASMPGQEMSMLRRSPSEMDVYVNTSSGELFKRTWNGSLWSSWIGMPGGTFAGSPAALQYNSEMDVYARGTNDSHIYKDTWQPSNNTWSGWNSLGGNEAGDPTAIQYRDGCIRHKLRKEHRQRHLVAR